MKTALIAMTILGCDHTATECTYVAAAEQTYETVALCDAASEAEMARHADSAWPMILAVCQAPKPDTDGTLGTLPLDGAGGETATIATATGNQPKASPEEEKPEGLFGHTRALVGKVLPAVRRTADVLATPVHVVTDTYSWAVRRITGPRSN